MSFAKNARAPCKRDVLAVAEAFSSELASTLRFHPTANERNDAHAVDQDVGKAKEIPLRSHSPRGRSTRHQASATIRVAIPERNSNDTMSDSEFSDSTSVCGEGHTEAFHDETTMAMAEAEEEKDPYQMAVGFEPQAPVRGSSECVAEAEKASRREVAWQARRARTYWRWM
ncbi:hypothetical protein FGB62_201g012 [Gracilaria domingensis]|nr:hypothetical protein FGB62_201g012 [Gracilaria domingensis]